MFVHCLASRLTTTTRPTELIPERRLLAGVVPGGTQTYVSPIRLLRHHVVTTGSRLGPAAAPFPSKFPCGPHIATAVFAAPPPFRRSTTWRVDHRWCKLNHLNNQLDMEDPYAGKQN